MSAHNNDVPCVNAKMGKCSHFVLYSDHRDFTGTQAGDLGTATLASVPGYVWDVKVLSVASNKKSAAVRLKTSGVPTAPAAKTAKKIVVVGTLDSGEISVTLTNGPSVDSVEVTFVDDDEV